MRKEDKWAEKRGAFHWSRGKKIYLVISTSNIVQFGEGQKEFQISWFLDSEDISLGKVKC